MRPDRGSVVPTTLTFLPGGPTDIYLKIVTGGFRIGLQFHFGYEQQESEIVK